jgi:hypothetical protein
MTAPPAAPPAPPAAAPAAPPVADAPYKVKLAALQWLTPDALADLETEIAKAFEEADANNNVPAMEEATVALEQVQAHATSLGLPANDPDGDGDDDTDPNKAPEQGQPPAAETPQPPATGQPVAAQPQEAAVNTPPVAADRQPIATPVAAATNVVVAGADVPHVSAGSPFQDRRQFAEALSDKINAIRHAQGTGEHVLVASVKTPDPDDSRMLEIGDFSGNMEKILDVVGRDEGHMKALVASGGYCAPLEPRYDVFGIGSTNRPVRGALPGFRAQRGGIRFITPPKLSGLTGSVGVWTAAVDAAPGGATKNKLIVTCGAEQTVSISAITSELQFGNFIARAYPEMVERNVELSMIAQARLAEQTLLTGIGTLSTPVTTATNAFGVARDWLILASQGASAYRMRHRMDPETQIRIVAPAWLRDAIRDDIALSKSPTSDDVLGEADAQIDAWISARNLRVAWHMDDTAFILNQAAGALNTYPTSLVWYLFAEGTFLFLDGGTLDIGVVRDSTLVSTNDYIQFTENFEAVAMVGVEAYRVTSTLGTGVLQGKTGT